MSISILTMVFECLVPSFRNHITDYSNFISTQNSFILVYINTWMELDYLTE